MKSKGKTQSGVQTSAVPVPSAASGGAAAPSLAAGASAASSSCAGGSSASAMLASGRPGLARGGASRYAPVPPAARRPPPVPCTRFDCPQPLRPALCSGRLNCVVEQKWYSEFPNSLLKVIQFRSRSTTKPPNSFGSRSLAWDHPTHHSQHYEV